MRARGPERDEKKVPDAGKRPPIPAAPLPGGFGPVFDRRALRTSNEVCEQLENALKRKVDEAIHKGTVADLIRLHNHFRDVRREARFGPVSPKKAVEQAAGKPGEQPVTPPEPAHAALDLFSETSFSEFSGGNGAAL